MMGPNRDAPASHGRLLVQGNRNQTFGLLLVAVGLLFLLARSFSVDLGDVGWPLFILIPGLLLLAGTVRGKDGAILAVPGCVVTTIGLILLVQNLSGRFETWAYAWALLPAAVGVGQVVQGRLTENDLLQRTGRHGLLTGLGLFAAFGLFFELFIFGGLAGRSVSGFLLPILLIAGGIYLLRPGGKPEEAR